MVIFGLILKLLLFLEIQGAGRYGNPARWEKDNQGDCKKCLVARQFMCSGKERVCDTGIYEDKLYKSAFKNHCFGKDQLDENTVNKFLAAIETEKKNWRQPLRKLVEVIDGVGLWTEPSFIQWTSCKMQPKAYQRRSLVDMRDSLGNLSKSGDRYIKTRQYVCATNNSAVWREQFSYCGPKDQLTTRTNCLCTDSIHVLLETDHCFDDYGYSNPPCEVQTFVSCECSGIASSPVSATTSVQRNIASSTKVLSDTASKLLFETTEVHSDASMTLLPTQKSTSKSSFPNRKQEDLKTIVTVLCAFVAFLLFCIFTYCGWRLCCKKPSSVEEETDSLHPTDVSTAYHDTIIRDQETTASRLNSDNYFSVGDRNENAIYHTIDTSFRSRQRPESSSMGPPLPSRLFSVSSMVAELSLCTSSIPQRSAHTSTSQCSTIDPFDQLGSRDAAYATIGARQDDQAYEIPVSAAAESSHGEDLATNQYEFASEREREDLHFNRDLRINPLYATSDDEAI
ncbi:unnamed protein product [Clavelina lepadiformis]|uniref:Uncharacterized protein n=1 Tax=Clavelina lepadiformis TaxID=159417 RepID=A0ABP0F7I4_CLALP